MYLEPHYISPCHAGGLFGIITASGLVYPCEILDSSHMIGNIRDYNLNFKNLWLSNKAKEEVSFIRKTKCFCTHECFNQVNILFNPKYYPKVIKIASSIK